MQGALSTVSDEAQPPCSDSANGSPAFGAAGTVNPLILMGWQVHNPRSLAPLGEVIERQNLGEHAHGGVTGVKGRSDDWSRAEELALKRPVEARYFAYARSSGERRRLCEGKNGRWNVHVPRKAGTRGGEGQISQRGARLHEKKHSRAAAEQR
ncbi:hypothetical protein NDU88_007374 [Pleurodeles waltl]|uniref:Uncharacterized protein n=1 Tax=Pleurodeles waltl TaxID=8319 RepID=A0AAV7P0N7_PLEWA|nr:hypothetical protein NDU88_007374 [Pleurodeles waltl]